MPFNFGSIANKIVCGEVSGSATAKQLPDIDGGLVWIQALDTNAGNVYVGGAGVTIPDGTTDVTSGMTLAAGDWFGPLTIKNLSMLYIICTNAGDDITYFIEQA